jgi:hypothetical protein
MLPRQSVQSRATYTARVRSGKKEGAAIGSPNLATGYEEVLSNRAHKIPRISNYRAICPWKGFVRDGAQSAAVKLRQ